MQRINSTGWERGKRETPFAKFPFGSYGMTSYRRTSSHHLATAFVGIGYQRCDCRPDGNMNLDEEVRLYTTNAERERTENLATLYSIIVSLEYLERAYVRDSVTGKEYVPLIRPDSYMLPRRCDVRRPS